MQAAGHTPPQGTRRLDVKRTVRAGRKAHISPFLLSCFAVQENRLVPNACSSKAAVRAGTLLLLLLRLTHKQPQPRVCFVPQVPHQLGAVGCVRLKRPASRTVGRADVVKQYSILLTHVIEHQEGEGLPA
jgi:hypothetical protein